MKRKFNVGDRVRVIKQNKKGTITEINGAWYVVQCMGCHPFFCTRVDLVKLVKKKKAPVNPVLTRDDIVLGVTAVLATINTSIAAHVTNLIDDMNKVVRELKGK